LLAGYSGNPVKCPPKRLGVGTIVIIAMFGGTFIYVNHPAVADAKPKALGLVLIVLGIWYTIKWYKKRQAVREYRKVAEKEAVV